MTPRHPSSPLGALLALILAGVPLAAALAAHPTGDIDPASARAAGIAPDIDHIDCLDCHTNHGAVGEALLHPAGQGQSCESCHVGLGGKRSPNEHPRGVRLSDATALASLARQGLRLGTGDTIICSSCHRVHGDAMDPAESCSVCHGSHQNGRNDADKPGGHADANCMGCHPIHESAAQSSRRPTELRSGDPTACLSCHGPGGSTDKVLDDRAEHPLFDKNPQPYALPSVNSRGVASLGTAGKTGCLTCHDTHVDDPVANPSMLRLNGPNAELCVACHPDEGVVVGTDHDAVARGRSEHALDTCLTCHGMHEKHGRHGWAGRAPRGSDESQATLACLGCHRQGNQEGGTVIAAWAHPRELNLTVAQLPWSNTGELPLHDLAGKPTDDKKIGLITCLTCHDPHRWSAKVSTAGGATEGDVRTSFLRDGWEGFCAGCHGEEALPVYKNFHDPKFRKQMQEQSERRKWPIYDKE